MLLDAATLLLLATLALVRAVSPVTGLTVVEIWRRMQLYEGC